MSNKVHRFDVQYAPGSMATCRVCMAKIVKDSLRIGHVVLELDNDGNPVGAEDYQTGATRWHHFECFHKMKGAKWMAVNLPANPAKSVKGFKDVKKADQKKITELWSALSGSTNDSTKGKKRKASNDQDVPSAKRAMKAASKASASATVAALTTVKGVLKDQEFRTILKLEDELNSKSIAQLQAELEHNNQIRAGKKSDLVTRVAEGRVLGSLPKCPKCKHGRIHWSRLGGWYNCPGYYDKDAQIQKRCFFRTQDLKRGSWKKK